MLNLVARRNWFYLFSFLLVIPGAISLLIPPRLQPAIELALSKEHGGFLDTQGNPTTQFTEFSSVSAAVSKQIGRNAAYAVLLASLFIMAYITYAFRNVPN